MEENEDLILEQLSRCDRQAADGGLVLLRVYLLPEVWQSIRREYRRTEETHTDIINDRLMCELDDDESRIRVSIQGNWFSLWCFLMGGMVGFAVTLWLK